MYIIFKVSNNFEEKRERIDRRKNSKVKKLQACEYKYTY